MKFLVLGVCLLLLFCFACIQLLLVYFVCFVRLIQTFLIYLFYLPIKKKVWVVYPRLLTQSTKWTPVI